jgi:hypothetical protein
VVLLKNYFSKLTESCKFMTHPFWTCKGWRSPTGNPSEVKCFSNSLASNNVTESRGPSLWPSNCSDELGKEPVLGEKKKLWRFIKGAFKFTIVSKTWCEQNPEKHTKKTEELHI